MKISYHHTSNLIVSLIFAVAQKRINIIYLFIYYRDRIRVIFIFISIKLSLKKLRSKLKNLIVDIIVFEFHIVQTVTNNAVFRLNQHRKYIGILFMSIAIN